jgi:hypothetical protein
MTPDEVRPFFTHEDGGYRFARWTGPIRPLVLGGDLSAEALLAGHEEAAALSGQRVEAPAHPGAMTYAILLVREWRELIEVPGLGAFLPDVAKLASGLAAGGFNQQRHFRFDHTGGIASCLALVRTGGRLGAYPRETLAFRQAVLAHLYWSIPKLAAHNLAGPDGALLPAVAALLKAGYRASVPAASRDPAHAALIAAET